MFDRRRPRTAPWRRRWCRSVLRRSPTQRFEGCCFEEIQSRGSTKIVNNMPSRTFSSFACQLLEKSFAFQLVDDAFVEILADVHVDFHGRISLRDDFQGVAQAF